MSIGQNLKQRRLQLDMTLEDVAKLVGVSRQTLSRYETGVIGNIPSDQIEALAKALNTTPAALMGWEDLNPPTVTKDYYTFPIIGDVAAGYDHIAEEDWENGSVDIPVSYLHGRPFEDYFVLRVIGDSMYPLYQEGDLVLVLKQTTMNHSGEIGVVIYNDNQATLKRVEYVMGEDWMKLSPVNPNYPPIMVRDEALEHCRVLGVPKMLVREIR